ncbi:MULTISPECIES: hypothetical protein [Vitreoscilla]|uniref:Lipoprotein n=1 Tax=Vitreoscilla stercoraria TaxID=61 RepID=A0ABY4EDI5_VITST|nr:MULTISPECIES: hypothetical protein [Vitreoscilla]AUZ05911.1 hypothetical protein ADP71_26150 [Vitreoscilla sp. C1]UOO92718.1 hypothetical protein LVJ81_01330 [Vitreoscilla stercoraria]
MKRFILCASVLGLLAACQTGSHVTQHYSAEAMNAKGQIVSKKTNFSFNKEGQDLAVQTICQSQRNTHSVVVKNRLGIPVEGSPFKCR